MRTPSPSRTLVVALLAALLLLPLWIYQSLKRLQERHGSRQAPSGLPLQGSPRP